MQPNHPEARRFLENRLFHGLSSFRELEGRLATVSEPPVRETAFALLAEGILTLRMIPQAVEVMPILAVTPEKGRRLSLPENRDEIDGYLRTPIGDVHPYTLRLLPDREPLTEETLTPFLAHIQRFDNPLLLSNGTSLPSCLSKQGGFFRLLAPDLDRLTSADFRRFQRWLQGGGIAPAQAAPGLDQMERVNQVRTLSQPRATLLLPMGGNVPHTVQRLVDNPGGQRTVLVLVPSLGYLRSLIRHWQGHSSWTTLSTIAVAPETSPIKGCHLDFPLSDHSAQLRRFLAARISGGIKLILATDKALPLIHRAMLGFPPLDLTLVLEAHRLATPQGSGLNKALETESPATHKLYFLTDAPHRADPLKPNKEGEIRPLYRLDNEATYGPQVTLATLPEGIQKKAIRPWKLQWVVLSIDQDHPTALALCLHHDPEIRHLHTRHDKADQAHAFCRQWHKQRPAEFAHMDAYCPEEIPLGAETDLVVEQYRHAQHALLALATDPERSFDLPEADLIYLANAAKQEETSTFQPIFTPRPGGRPGVIAIPLFLLPPSTESHATESQATESQDHRRPPRDQEEIDTPSLSDRLDQHEDLWTTLQLFREQDETLAQVLRATRIQQGRTGHWDLTVLQPWLDILTPSGPPSDALARTLLTHCIQRMSTLWDERLGQLLAFRDRHGHCDVPPRWPDNPELSQWMDQQRKLYQKNALDPQRVQELEEIDFTWDPSQKAWEGLFQQLLVFKAQHHHCNVPKGWSSDPLLADWVARQRRDRQNGRLDPEWETRLTHAGFIWDLEAEAWADGFARLERFRTIHGHAQVPLLYPPDPTLAEWAEAQRKQEKKGTLDENRLQRLDATGFIWDMDEAAWEERFQLFERFKQIHGHGKVPDKSKEMPKLSEWALQQRRDKEQNKLDPLRQQRLDQAGFVWDLEWTQWQERFARLKAFKFAHHHCTLVSEKGWETGSEAEQLALWSQEQRTLRQRGQLHPTRIDRLTALGFAWDLKESAWEEMFYRFQRFIRCHGHGKLPERHADDPALGQWAKGVRREWILGKLDPQQQARLTEIGFVWDLEAADWEEGFAQLRHFYQTEGHFSLPPVLPAQPNLPGWVKKQRSDHAKRKLKKERVHRLEKIGFLWDVRQAAWEEMFTALRHFARSRQHCLVPKQWTKNPRLAQWVTGLRRDYKKGTLEADKIERLTQLGFLWDDLAVFWEEMFAALTEYREQYGDCLVPEGYPDNNELGWWVATQRKARLADQLDETRIARLDDLDFIWNADDAHWLEHYRKLFNFRTQHGHCLVPKTKPETMALALWADQQRKAREQHQLSQDQINRLTDLGFLWDARLVVAEEMLRVLQTFKAEHGHCEVPTQNSPHAQLGLWLQFQRQSKKKGTLDPIREEKLRAMGYDLEG